MSASPTSQDALARLASVIESRKVANGGDPQASYVARLLHKGPDAFLKKMSPADWNAVINTNLNSVFNVTRQVIEGMAERGWGRVINMSSVNAIKGQYGQANYSAAKAGMHGFTKAVAQEVVRKGVTVNTISPGYVATDMTRAIKPAILESIVAQIPMGRMAQPEEIAGLIAYLVSDEAAYITGANLSINGGMHMM